jgi:hypothetical protein
MAERLGRIEHNLERLPETVRQNVATELWSRIPAVVNESVTQNMAAAGVIVVPAAFGVPVLIDTIVVSLPAGVTGLITLGPDTLPVPAGTLTTISCRKILTSQDVRSLTVSGAGLAALWLMGEQAPTTGILRG